MCPVCTHVTSRHRLCLSGGKLLRCLTNLQPPAGKEPGHHVTQQTPTAREAEAKSPSPGAAKLGRIPRESLPSVSRATDRRPNAPKTNLDPRRGTCQTPKRPEPHQAEFLQEITSHTDPGQPHSQPVEWSSQRAKGQYTDHPPQHPLHLSNLK